MASTTIFLNDQYATDTSTNTVVGYVDATVEKAKTDILNDLLNEVDSIVEESISSKMSSYSLTSHLHDSYATKDELLNYSTISHQHDSYALASDVYNKQEVDLKILTFTPELTDYPTREELLQQLNNYSTISHTHDSYALADNVYTKSETENLVNSHVPDLSDYATKDELLNYSTVSHTHDSYALVENVYTKNETENLVNSHTPDLSEYFTKSETNNLISGFKPIAYLTTQLYEELESKDPSTLYVLTDSTEEEIDLSLYVTKDELEQKNYKTILYITTQLYEELESKDPSTLYILTDSEEEAVDLTAYYTKNETDNLISGFKPIQYLTTQEYEELESKDPSTLYVLTDSEEETIDLSQYVTKTELEEKNYKSIAYLTTSEYEELESKDPSTLYILTDSQEEAIDLSAYYTKNEIDAKGFKPISYLTTSEYEALENKDADTLYILTDSQEETIDLSQFSLTNHQHADYALNSSLSKHINDASAHFTSEEREAYDAFAGEFYHSDELIWDILPKSAFDDTMGDMSAAMGQFDTRIANNDSSISAIKSRLNEFSLTSHTHADYVLNSSLSDNYYNKTQTDEKLDEKANICVLDIYAIESGDVTVTEEMWNEWMECLTNHGIFYQDNGSVRLTLEVSGGIDENGDETNSIEFNAVYTLGYSYRLFISKEDDGKGNISFVVNSPVENDIVFDIDDINEWDDDKWNYVIGNLGSNTIFKLGGFPLSISYDGNNKLTISTVEEGAVKVYTVTRAETRSLPTSYTYTVNEEEQYEVEVIDNLSTWNDEKWNLVSKNSNGARLFTHNGNPLNVSENKEGQLLLSYLENGTALRVVTVTQVATKAAVGNTYTVETNNFYIADIENKQDTLNYYIEDDNLATIAMSVEEEDSRQGTNMTVDLTGLEVVASSSTNENNMTALISVWGDGGPFISHVVEYTEENLEYGATTAHSWIEVYNDSITMDASLGSKRNIFKIDPSAVTINDDRVLTETDLDDFYTKSYIDTSLNNVYIKSQTDTLIASKADSTALSQHMNDASAHFTAFEKNIYDELLDLFYNGIWNIPSMSYLDDDYYNKTYIDTSLNDVYTKDYIDTSLNNVYTKSYIDTSLNDIYTKSQVYTKTEIDTMIGDIETVLATI